GLGYGPGGSRLRVVTSENNSFRVVLDRSQIFTASEYLRWSDQFQPHFDLIRQALKRPHARMDGDYEQPFAIPVPNVKTFRLASQTLAQRAQCYLLLGQPENALRELTLIHQMLRLLDAKPITMMSAMLQVALTGVHANV